MSTVTLPSELIRRIHRQTSPDFQAALERALPSEFFNTKVTDRIKTFEDACHELSINHSAPEFTDGPVDEVAYRKLKVVILALNEGWTPNWNKDTERKWAPWFYLDNPGFRFLDSFYGFTDSCAAGGSRLCFKSQELSDYAGRQFIDLYKAFLA